MRVSFALLLAFALLGSGVSVAGQTSEPSVAIAVMKRLGIDDAALFRPIEPVSFDGSTIWPVFWRRHPDATIFAAAVVRRSIGGGLHLERLPPPREVDGRFDLNISDVGVVSAGRESLLVVLYSVRAFGDTAPTGSAGYAYRFEGRSWTIDKAITHRLIGANSLDDAAARAGAPKNRIGTGK